MKCLVIAIAISFFVSVVAAFHGRSSGVSSTVRRSSINVPTQLDDESEENNIVPSHSQQQQQQQQQQRRSILPPPPCSRSNPADDLFRDVRRSWPVWLQTFLRESGFLRTLEDALIVVGIPALMRQYPGALEQFINLSRRTTEISYGNHKMQFVDYIEPIANEVHKSPSGIVAFVHGGAWGSGRPWMYRLCALPFLSMNKAVAIIGYRTYPDANVDGQVDDIRLALNEVIRKQPGLMTNDGEIEALVGHSSGAHIGLLHVLESAKGTLRQRDVEVSMTTCTPISKFVALSGVYCIPSHYEYEKGRGVDQLSALRAACGPEEKLEEASPTYRLDCLVKPDGSEECILLDADIDENETAVQIRMLNDYAPEMFFVHGVEDNVVQYTQTLKIVDTLHSALAATSSSNTRDGRCHEVLLDNIGHADTVLQLMNGGITRDLVEDIIMGRGTMNTKRKDN